MGARRVADDLVDYVGAQIHDDVVLADVAEPDQLEQPEVGRHLPALVRVDQEYAGVGTDLPRDNQPSGRVSFLMGASRSAPSTSYRSIKSNR